MFERPHHKLIGEILRGMNKAVLEESSCVFGGGTAIALQLNEYRESRDIDFLVSDMTGYKRLREALHSGGLQAIIGSKIEIIRGPRADRDAIRAVLGANNGEAVKFEIVVEGRIKLDPGEKVPGIPVICASRTDLFAEKLLANTDRYLDKAYSSRDIIDVIMMERHWGAVPAESWRKVEGVYGQTAKLTYMSALRMLATDRAHAQQCAKDLNIPPQEIEEISRAAANSIFRAAEAAALDSPRQDRER